VRLESVSPDYFGPQQATALVDRAARQHEAVIAASAAKFSGRR
jgi:hypothetical protein